MLFSTFDIVRRVIRRFFEERCMQVAASLSFSTLIGLVPWALGHGLRVWALIVAVFFLGAAYLAPKLLAPLNRLWFRFGLVLHAVVNPLIMGLIFFGAVLPTGLMVRLFHGGAFHLRQALGVVQRAERGEERVPVARGQFEQVEDGWLGLHRLRRERGLFVAHEFLLAMTRMLSPQRIGKKMKPVMACRPPSEPKNNF